METAIILGFLIPYITIIIVLAILITITILLQYYTTTTKTATMTKDCAGKAENDDHDDGKKRRG